MNKKLIAATAAIIIVVGGGLYYVYDQMTGNKVEIESVLSTQNAGSENTTQQAEGSVEAENQTDGTNEVAEASLDGVWNIADTSNVYFSVTTSRETVNYELSDVSGTWNIDSNDPSSTTAEATVAITTMNSGNSQRDGHVTSADYLDAAQFPNATFELTNFNGLTSDWTNGEVTDVTFTGNLTVKGVTKEVEFTGKAQYDAGSLKLEATTVVTFADFGMESPHAIVMDTENDLTIQLQLVLNQ